MISGAWLKGLFRRRAGRLCGAILGVGLTVTLLADIGLFTAFSAAAMTKRAVADVPVDWQVQTVNSANPAAVMGAMKKGARFSALARVGYADTAGFTAQTGGTLQTTGPGKVLGIPRDYRRLFPAEVRQLTGAREGVLVAQQTAANLHVKEGDTLSIMRVGLAPVLVKVNGIVDLPAADSLFQAIGMPAGTAPQAPPDNVVLLPDDVWHRVFDGQAVVRPDSVHTQVHAKLAENLPADPVKASIYAQQLANNLEARIAGGGIVGNNLAARLDGVREDALYARVLFLFLGVPGVALAILLTLAVSASGSTHRRQEQALMRVRGASTRQLLRLAALEASAVGLGGALLGSAATLAAWPAIVPGGMPVGGTTIQWFVVAGLAGFILALAAILYPAWKESRHASVASTRVQVGRPGRAWWQKVFLDLALLVVAAIMIWRTAAGGYQIVLAPEGVPATSVHYEAFLGPLCLWVGGILLALRLWENGLLARKRLLARILKPVGRELSSVVAASLGRQRTMVAGGIIFAALALSFAVSTSIFNATYNAQSRVDAELTNGSDVTVTGMADAAPSLKLDRLRSLPGVQAAEPMLHRFAYVGSDLQDIYGINPSRIERVTHLSNAYFAGGSARAVLSALARQSDGVLVAEETVRDFQLHPGDRVNLRLMGDDHQYHVIPFHFIGIVREFPTAPTDSFLVANANYIAHQTHIDTAETVLMRAKGDPAGLAAAVRKAVRDLPGAKVSDILSTSRTIGSSLTAVDLRGLTHLELFFAIALLMGATGLMLALGLAERKRTFAVLAALGARKEQLGAFLWSEGLLVWLGGSLTGAVMGLGIAVALVKVLTGVFDPPPQFLSVPWGYLAALGVSSAVATALAVILNNRHSTQTMLGELKSL